MITFSVVRASATPLGLDTWKHVEQRCPPPLDCSRARGIPANSREFRWIETHHSINLCPQLTVIVKGLFGGCVQGSNTRQPRCFVCIVFGIHRIQGERS